MDCFSTSTIYESSLNPYCLLFQGISLIPLWHYFIASLIFIVLFLYNFIEFHFFEDLLTGFRGSPVSLTFNPRSHIYDAVVSKCSILHARFFSAFFVQNFLDFIFPGINFLQDLFSFSLFDRRAGIWRRRGFQVLMCRLFSSVSSGDLLSSATEGVLQFSTSEVFPFALFVQRQL